MQAPCPHCDKTLPLTYLNKVMDEMAGNQHFAYNIEHSCPHCRKKIMFSKELYTYYIINKNNEKDVIGMK
ncbi:hypothetical protein F975_01656 [Acinetobacter sp. ANC 3789]|nr:hypothetical protein F975_01656 [Acinetobacter sp. ANC 3789]